LVDNVDPEMVEPSSQVGGATPYRVGAIIREKAPDVALLIPEPGSQENEIGLVIWMILGR
jgi:hypothetical protein